MASDSTTAAASSTLTTTLNDPGPYNWGPITSVFVPPTTCYNTLTSATNDGVLYVGHNDQNYFDPACYPVGSVGTSTLEQASSWGLYYYSPAICPFGFTIAATFESSFLGLGPPNAAIPTEALNLGQDTTAALCCPTGYGYTDIGHGCASTAAVGEIIEYIYPTLVGKSEVVGAVTISSVRDVTSVFCDGIPVWWQSSDLAALSSASQITGSGSNPSSSSSSSSYSTTTSLTSNPTPTNTSSNKSAPSSSPSPTPSTGLSQGAKIGIGVAIPVAFLALLGGLVWYFRLRRRTKALKLAAEGPSYGNNRAEVRKAQPGVYNHELANNMRPAEIYTHDPRYQQPLSPQEMPNTYR